MALPTLDTRTHERAQDWLGQLVGAIVVLLALAGALDELDGAEVGLLGGALLQGASAIRMAIRGQLDRKERRDTAPASATIAPSLISTEVTAPIEVGQEGRR